MSTAESSEVERVATVTPLPSRAMPDPEPAVPAVPSVSLPSPAQIFDFVVPPDIWSDDRPSLRKIWLYAVYGRWTQASGPVRVAGAIYGVVAMAFTTVLYLLAWIVERPARAAVAVALYFLIKLAF
jgi:hypothetical protein